MVLAVYLKCLGVGINLGTTSVFIEYIVY